MDTISTIAPEPAGDASSEQYLDVFELIKLDHRHVQELFSSYQSATNEEQKLAIAREICTSVVKHASAEERLIYPLIKTVIPDYQANKMLYDMMMTDDQTNKDVLQFLDTHTPKDQHEWAVFDKVMNKFIMIETEHFDKEESMVCDALSRSLTRDEKTDLYHKFQSALKTAPLHPHPSGGTTELAAKITHPVAGVVDRAAHAMSGLVHRVFRKEDKGLDEAAYQGTEAGRERTPTL